MPRRVYSGFSLAFRVCESGRQCAAIHHCCAVRSEDHVGQAGQGVDQLDGVAEAEICLPERFPLRDGERVVVGRRGIHPRVDPVRDREVGGAAHEVSAHD